MNWLSLPEALAWVIWRDNRRVSRIGRKGLSLMDTLDEAVREGGEIEKRALAARKELLAKLEAGELVALGVRSGAVLREDISADTWHLIDSVLVFDNVGPRDVGRDGKTFFSDVVLKAADVCRLWPEGGPDLREACRRAFADGKTSQGEALKAVKASGVICTRKEFLEVWPIIAGPQKRGPKGPRSITPK